ncbi:MAG: transglycosylase domain-containing protein [Actinomycetota bacterium]
MLHIPTRPAVAVCALGLTLSACAQIDDLPQLRHSDLAFKPAQSSRIFASDGRLITTMHGVEDRTVVPLGAIPKHLQQAVVAIEDERFYEHDGVDLRAIMRAAVTNAASGEIREGGSTITQQYVKTVIIAPGATADQTIQRKIDEAVLARQMERRLSKREILERYLNTVYFGNGAYGVQAAARTYFGKSATMLTLAESALLAAVIRSPETYDPLDRRKAARARRNVVLVKMTEQGRIPLQKAARAQAAPIELHPTQTTDRYPAPYFVDYVRRLIKFDDRFKMLGATARQRESLLFNGGLHIYTTVDLDMQRAAEQAWQEVLPYKRDPHASIVSIDPRSGYVKAMVGGRDYFAPRKKNRFAKFNLAITGEPGLDSRPNGGSSAGTGRQAGSAFKPFALAAALEKGISLAESYEADSCMNFPGANNGGNWRVCNYEGSSFGSELSLLEATVNSVNVVYAQLILALGAEPVVDLAQRMGINTPLAAVPAAVLGANSVNPLGMASAYGTLATNGKHHPPVAIEKITDAGGEVLFRDRSKSAKVMAPAAAYITTSALEQVMQRGTGVGATIDRPAAGKTGTAQEYRDAWFVGYTPFLTTAVWVGYPRGEIEMKPSCAGSTQPCRATRTATSGGVTGGSWPASIWRLFMARALSGVPARGFQVPGGIVRVVIDARNGCLAGRFTPAEYREYASFVPGTEPVDECREPGDAVTVPSVLRFPVEDALRVLERAGLIVERRTKQDTTYPPGRVIALSPKAGTLVPAGSTVTITVSARGGGTEQTATVPDVLGMTRSQATSALEAARFKVRAIIDRESNRSQAKKNRGRVWKQAPAGGARAERGSTVTIWINPG